MEDSHFSHPEYQMVLETEAESLMYRDFERILEKDGPMTKDEDQFYVPGQQSNRSAG